jgi:hypothetical protein
MVTTQTGHFHVIEMNSRAKQVKLVRTWPGLFYYASKIVKYRNKVLNSSLDSPCYKLITTPAMRALESY